MSDLLRANSGGLRPLKWYRSLHESRGRKEAECFLIEGERAIGFLTENHPHLLIEILTTQNHLTFSPQSVPVRTLDESQFRTVAISQHPAGPLAVVKIPEASYSDTLPPQVGNAILVIEDVQDPGNVGTLLRTAAALGFSGALLSEKSADPFGPKAAQAGAGSTVSLWIRRSSSYLDSIEELKKQGFSCVGTDMRGEQRFPTVNKFMLVMGNEGSGISDALRPRCDYHYGIPMHFDKAESLNVAAAGAICMFAALHRDS